MLTLHQEWRQNDKILPHNLLCPYADDIWSAIFSLTVHTVTCEGAAGYVPYLLYGELSEGTCNIGRPKLCFKDQCKMSMMEFSINVVNWDMVAQDRVRWRAAILIEAKSCEKNRVQCAIKNRQRRKCPTVDDSTAFYCCRHCQKPHQLCIDCFSNEQHTVPRQLIFHCRPSPSMKKAI